MPYNYQLRRADLFTENGQVLFLSIRDHTKALLAKAGAARMGEMIENQVGDSWTMIACVDRMVELGELREIPQADVAGQDRVFVSAK